MQCIDIALNYDSKYIVGYNIKGNSLQHSKFINLKINNLGKYNDAIVCFDKAIQLDPNFALAYYNKGALLQILTLYKQSISIEKVLISYRELLASTCLLQRRPK